MDTVDLVVQSPFLGEDITQRIEDTPLMHVCQFMDQDRGGLVIVRPSGFSVNGVPDRSDEPREVANGAEPQLITDEEKEL